MSYFQPMKRLSSLARVLVAAVLVAGAAHAAPVRTEHVEAELVAERTAIVPGQPLTVALRLAMQRGWHTYWRNPGDSGLPTTLTWNLPRGLSAGPIEWAPPHALPVGPLMNFGYEGEVLLLSDITTPGDLTEGKPVTLAARADWLVCKEICIPEGADLSLTLPVARVSEADPRWGGPIASARAALPRPLEGLALSASGAGRDVVLTLGGKSEARDPGQVYFFPYKAGLIEPSAPQTLTRDGDQWKLKLAVANQRVGEFDRVAGVIIGSTGFGAQRAASIDVPLEGSIAGSSPVKSAPAPLPLPTESETLSFGLALLFAFVGGMLLNLMPCVFPVLSLKVLGFATHGGGRAEMRLHGLAFAAGVMVSFWLLAAALIALRAAGGELGWGFQLQSPAVITALAILFFVMALSLSGVFDFGRLVPSSVATWDAKRPLLNDALSGVLAVVVASPCSAPFMGAALGYALTAPRGITLGVFTSLAIGMALPYLLLAFFPNWRTRLPRPGPWMQRLKQFLAFPLYATVLWLAWVLGAQLDNDAVLRLGLALLLIALALWAWQSRRSGALHGWTIGALAGVAAAAAVVWPVVAASTPSGPARSVSTDAGPWQAYAPDRLAQLVSDGRTVFIDFTAAWCVTCQVNKRLVLSSAEVNDAFSRHNVALLRADWTRRDPAIGQALAALGRSGVPAYVLYRPGREPLLLPEVLQRSTITDALATVDKSETASTR